MRAPVLVPALVAGGAEAAYAVAVLRTPLEDPRSADFAAIFYVRSAALAALSVGLVWTVLRRRRLRAAVARLAVEIRDAPPAGRLREALALAVGDPTLDIAYGFSGSGLYIRGDGTRIEAPLRRAGRAVTPIVHHGRPIAVVDHDAALLDGSGFERELGSAARLAIENERLHAEVLAQLEDIRSSRARIVERGDAERRRLERDLHDGAQQRLLALSYDLRLARASAEAAGDVEAAALLASAVDEAQTALNELRELAHGIYPAILAEAGLAPALASLADEAPLPVEMRDLPVDRFGPAVETAAYLTVAEAIEDASRRSATFVSVEIARAAAVLTVAARDDGLPRGAPLVHLSDRIGALGGSLVFDATGVRAEIPCG
jgi:signal transduction histidine kinase